MGNTGTAYEQLVQRVFQEILDQDTARTIEVKQNIVLQGKTTKHQVDVYWEFEIGGITYRTVIQCKDWKDPVKQGELFALKTVLDDLPGQPRGVLVTRTGFQAGAREFAKAHGIILYELREPRERDWEGRIGEIHTTMVIYVPSARDFKLVPDLAWVQAERERCGLPNGERFSVGFGPGPAEDLVFLDEDGQPSISAADVIKAMFPPHQEEFTERLGSFEFAEPAYLETGHDRFPRVRLTSASAKIAMGRVEETMVIDFTTVPGFILFDVLGDDVEHMFDKDLRILGVAQTEEAE
jgi:hypothetical protein